MKKIIEKLGKKKVMAALVVLAVLALMIATGSDAPIALNK